MISKGRNLLQAQIDDAAIVLDRLLSEVPRQIKALFKELEKEIDGAGVGLPDEEAYTVKESIASACRMEDEDEMLESFYKSMVIMVCSYCERTLLSMLPSETKVEYKKKTSKINTLFRELTDVYDLKDIGTIASLWPSITQFIRLRNDIVHNTYYDTSLLNEDCIRNNLKMVRGLLRVFADKIPSSGCVLPER